MSNPAPIPVPRSRHQHNRLQNLGRRLHVILTDLEALTARRTPLPKAVAAPALRALGEAKRWARLPPHRLSPEALMPGDLFAETLLTLDYLTRLSRAEILGSPDFAKKSYPRGPRRR